ncbi:MAG: Rrf2 family transcriptional regulator [Candidatus Moraniibacteriota bacterium]|nr:MAG: Rrf2 family transcriptional regulator [Candidatus Moranbacteria bacterium]
MHISAKTYYGVKALSCLAHSKNSMSIKEISEKEEIPEEYLGKIFQQLRQAGFISSKRGSGGGYLLSYLPTEISLLDIFLELEGSFFEIPCFEESGCKKENSCQTKNLWKKINTTIHNSLEKISLNDII